MPETSATGVSTSSSPYPWIRSRQRSGALKLHGAWFDIALGELHVRGPRGWGRLDGH